MPPPENLKFPIGEFECPSEISADTLAGWINDLSAFPERVRTAVKGLSDQQLNTPYRPGSWSIRQLIHHCADSHLNGYTRLRLALTETNPTIKPYQQDGWAALPDSVSAPIEPSLQMLAGLHARWVAVLHTLGESDWARTYHHPEQGRPFRIDESVGVYAWHSNHHLAHITSCIRQNSWG